MAGPGESGSRRGSSIERARVDPLYLPLHELLAMSQRGSLIRLRQAQYHREWEPLLSYLVMIVAREFPKEPGPDHVGQ